MADIIVSDTSCLIVLSKTGQLELLQQLFSTVIVTPEVMREYGEPLPPWIQVQTALNIHLQEFLETQLDIGEASSICLALEIPSRNVLIDERKGRRIATEMGLNVLGTARVLILAKENGLITSLSEALNHLSKSGFRISEQLVKEILDKYEPNSI